LGVLISRDGHACSLYVPLLLGVRWKGESQWRAN